MAWFKTIIVSLFFLTTSAHSACSDIYKEIDGNCIKDYQAKLGEIKQKISSSSVGKTFLYETDKGFLGKMIILSVNVSKKKSDKYCDVLVDFETFRPNGNLKKTESLYIKNNVGSWTVDSLNFDKDFIKNDIKLINEYSSGSAVCYLVSDQSKLRSHSQDAVFKPAEGSRMLYVASLILIFLAVFLIAQTFFEDEGKYQAQEALESADEETVAKKEDALIRFSKPFFKRYFTPIVAAMKNKRKFRDKYRKKLANAGLLDSLSPEDFFALKLFLILGFPILFLVFRQFLEADWPIMATPIISGLGFIYPDIWIKGKMDARREEITIAMPFIVDMLALSVEAGLDFMAAIVRVIDKAPPSALVDEFKILIKETRVGASRADGLRQMSWRADTMQVSSFTATLIAADQVGASIGPILKSLSLEMRQKRSAIAEKKGATASTKILIPMMAFILPAVMCMIGAPFIMEFIK